jgi:hypothetical protein
MDHYSQDDQPQLQWLEDLVNSLLSVLAACFQVCWRVVTSVNPFKSKGN